MSQNDAERSLTPQPSKPSNLLERLRDAIRYGSNVEALCNDAADEIERLRAALERIAKDPDFGPSALGPAHGSGIYTGWIIARDIAREALSGASPEKNDG